MNVYTEGALFFVMPYKASLLLKEAICKTTRGMDAFFEKKCFDGFGHILIGQIESIAAFCLVTISALFLYMVTIPLTCCFVFFKLLFELPLISSFKSSSIYIQLSKPTIHQIIRIYLIVTSSVFLFSAACLVNTLLPGLLKTNNLFSHSIHMLVNHLGEIKTIKITDKNENNTYGMENHPYSIIDIPEEYARALSFNNKPQEIYVDFFKEHPARGRL